MADMFGSVSFTSPSWLLVIVPLLVLVGLQLTSRRKHGAIVLTGLEYVRGRTHISRTKRRLLAAALWSLIVVVLGVLWAGPVLHSSAPLFRGGAQTGHKDFLVVFDLSPSMSVPLGQTRTVTRTGPSARQVAVTVSEAKGPTRYEAARDTLMDFVGRFEGERIGLILFSTEPFLARWPTKETGSRFWEVLEENIGRGQRSQMQAFSSLTNTDLAVDLARDVFNRQEAVEGGAVILISDAEDDVGNMVEAFRQIRQDGIRLYTLGVGMSPKIVEPLSQQFADDPGFRIFSVESQDEMEEAYRLVAEVEASPLFVGEAGFETDLRWLLALAFGVLASLIFWILEMGFHQSLLADRAGAKRGRHVLRFS